MKTTRDILNEYKWRTDRDFSKIEVWYRHRGIEGDRKRLRGGDIINLKKSYIQIEDAIVPYHRILEILYDGEEIYRRTS